MIDCAKVPRTRPTFDSSVKCCTYVPDLANFLVGEALREHDPSTDPGRSSIIERIERGSGVTPLGLQVPPLYSLLYASAQKTPVRPFGKSPTLRCPHFVEGEAGNCGIWRSRNAVCATWFCRHERGKQGREFWMALKELLTAVEKELSIWCLGQLSFDASSIARIRAYVDLSHEQRLADELIEGSHSEQRRELWGQWTGRETTYYIECADLVAALSWTDVLEICGPHVRPLADFVRQRRKTLEERAVPFRLSMGSFQILDAKEDLYFLGAYSEFDAITLPQAAMPLLQAFDGRETDDVLSALGSEQRALLDTATLEQLVDHGILQAAAD